MTEFRQSRTERVAARAYALPADTLFASERPRRVEDVRRDNPISLFAKPWNLCSEHATLECDKAESDIVGPKADLVRCSTLTPSALNTDPNPR
jgi:hypothetical protein